MWTQVAYTVMNLGPKRTYLGYGPWCPPEQPVRYWVEEQVACNPPFVDLPFELLDDFDTWSESYQRHFKSSLNAGISREIDELRELANSLENCELEGTNLSSMKNPKWDPIRTKAYSILEKLSWPIEPPPQTVKGWWIYTTWSRP